MGVYHGTKNGPLASSFLFILTFTHKYLPMFNILTALCLVATYQIASAAVVPDAFSLGYPGYTGTVVVNTDFATTVKCPANYSMSGVCVEQTTDGTGCDGNAAQLQCQCTTFEECDDSVEVPDDEINWYESDDGRVTCAEDTNEVVVAFCVSPYGTSACTSPNGDANARYFAVTGCKTLNMVVDVEEAYIETRSENGVLTACDEPSNTETAWFSPSLATKIQFFTAEVGGENSEMHCQKTYPSDWETRYKEYYHFD